MLGFTFYRETGNQWSSISIYIVSFQNVYASDDRILCSVYWSGWLLFFPVHQGLFHTNALWSFVRGKWSVVFHGSTEIRDFATSALFNLAVSRASLKFGTQRSTNPQVFSPCTINPLRRSLPKCETLCYLSWCFLFCSQYFLF